MLTPGPVVPTGVVDHYTWCWHSVGQHSPTPPYLEPTCNWETLPIKSDFYKFARSSKEAMQEKMKATGQNFQVCHKKTKTMKTTTCLNSIFLGIIIFEALFPDGLSNNKC